MEFMEHLNMEPPEDDHMVVVVIKGKRTKRSRHAFSVNTASSCSSGSRGGGGSEISTCTDGDEDVANCLILLSQSIHEKTANSSISSIQIEANKKIVTSGRSSTQIEGQKKIITSIDRSSSQVEEVRISTPQVEDGESKLNSRKFSSKRFCEVVTPKNGNMAGVYVYECKTCNRSFSSFQALGGHRASHRKEAAQPPLHPHPSSESEKIHKKEKKQLLQLRHTTRKQAFRHSPATYVTELSQIHHKNEKVHECTICAAGFSSGQALGGHMRKHKNIPTNITKNSSNVTMELSEIDNDVGGKKSRNILELDLNLPAPPEDDHRDSKKFQFSGMFFPALVDCQY